MAAGLGGGGQSRQKSWAEFSATFAAAYLLCWLLEDLPEVSPDYFGELQRRIGEAIVQGQIWEDEPPDDLGVGEEWDRHVPLQGPGEPSRSAWFVPLDALFRFEEQLFPKGAGSTDFAWFARGITLAGMVGALEAYCKSLDVDTRRRSLTMAVRQLLATETPPKDLPAWAADALRECEATRNVFVHNRGIVDAAYVDTVPGNKFLVGERRSLVFGDLLRFAEGIWAAAIAVRTYHSTNPPSAA